MTPPAAPAGKPVRTEDPAPVVLWFRRDLRLDDHPALRSALEAGPVLPVFVWCPEEEAPWEPGRAARAWLALSLESLQHDLEKRGAPLVLRAGPAERELLDVCRAAGARRVFFTRRVEPAARRQEQRVAAGLAAEGIEAVGCEGGTLFEPGSILTGSGKPFQVFTPFSRACAARPVPAPLPAPRRIPAPSIRPEGTLRPGGSIRPERGLRSGGSIRPEGSVRSLGIPLSRLGLASKDELARVRACWQPGEPGARRALARFLCGPVLRYDKARNLPAEAGTSRLSPHLSHGEISARRIRHEAVKDGAVPEPFLRQLLWREFAWSLLVHFPRTPEEPLREEFRAFAWTRGRAGLKAWQEGRTGYPLVDAGMRELAATGWMHNRVRMVVASFLVKDLLLPWTAGARWFWDHLVDADLANNTLGWQWCAGCGADAAPYFRVFNPVKQGETFDPEGSYLARWVEELRGLPPAERHRPWEAEDARTGAPAYPRPIIDHGAARARALAAYAAMRSGR